MSITWLDANSSIFPATELALEEPNGLLAAGGDLSTSRLLSAYRSGIFPWYDEPPILWWSPNPRTVIRPSDLKISRSLKKTLKNAGWTIVADQQFTEVIAHCRQVRETNAELTWINSDMQAAYTDLFNLGFAHSIEVYDNDKLIGGLYGVAVGKIFSGESMFHLERDASKVAFVYLVKQLGKWGFPLIDCQVASDHLTRMGASDMQRSEYIEYLNKYGCQSKQTGHWQLDLNNEELF